MTPEEKFTYFKELIDEKFTLNPNGPLRFSYSTVLKSSKKKDVRLSPSEQWKIIKKLEKDGYIENIINDDKNGQILFNKVTRKKEVLRRSNVFSYINTTDLLLQHREIFERVVDIIGEIAPNHSYKHSTYEKDDDYIQLLIDLDLIEYDWHEIEKQEHREIGNRIIEFNFEANKIIAVKNRISGKNGRVKKEALELISKDIGDRFTFYEITQIFTDIGVPESMFIKDTKWRAVFYILSYYTTSKNSADYLLFLKILEKVLHPLSFEGDEKRAVEYQEKYNAYLKYDKIEIRDNKAYIGPTEEEINVRLDDWADSDGKTIEPKAYLILPEKVAEVWVLWSQIIQLVNAYQNNRALDHKEIEKIYLEIIEEVENFLDGDGLGKLKEMYSRPFISILTSDIEAKAKNAQTSVELINNFFIEITSLNPVPSLIALKIEEYADLLKRVEFVTRAMGGRENGINVEAISYEQAIFLLKVVAGHLFSILDVACTGYINLMDERLNAQYVNLSDYLTGILTRKDLAEIQKNLPSGLPENLFEMIDEMDIWWSECGGKSGMISFIGSIETAWIRTGQQTFPMPVALIDFFTNTNIFVSEHRKNKDKQWERITRNIDEEAKKNNGPLKQEQEAVQKIVHEHTHRFENSIQEKSIDLNHIFEKEKGSGFYITKKEDDIHYKGHYLNLSKHTDYYKVFCALYAKLPKGGEISYADLISEVKSRLPKIKDQTTEEMQKFIQRNLTDKSNGFMRYAGIPETEDNGKPLIEVNRGSGIIFNNTTG